MSPGELSRKPRRRLFWRIYIYAMIFVVVLIASTTGIMFLVMDRPLFPWAVGQQRMAAKLKGEFGPEPADLERLQTHLDIAHYMLRLNSAVFSGDGTRLAAAGRSPPEELDRRHAVSLDPGNDRSAWLMMREPGMHLRHPRHKGAIPLLLTLVVFGIFSLVLARSIAKPLEKLTGTARRIARGDLSARSGLDRKDEVGVLSRTMDEMASRLEARIRSEKELLANISHEIRTPLSRIRVALELCNEEDSTIESVKSHLSGIDKDVGELEQLLENVFTATRLDLAEKSDGESQLVRRKRSMQLQEAANQAVQRFHNSHPKHTLQLDLAPGLPTVEADTSLIKHMLNNLLDNAAKYSEPGTTVELVAKADSKHLTIEVRDRGMGVSDQDLPRLFEPFFRSDKSKARATGGTGLGLNLCQRIVEAHGGKIAAEQRPGGGLILRIDLPLEE